MTHPFDHFSQIPLIRSEVFYGNQQIQHYLNTGSETTRLAKAGLFLAGISATPFRVAHISDCVGDNSGQGRMNAVDHRVKAGLAQGGLLKIKHYSVPPFAEKLIAGQVLALMSNPAYGTYVVNAAGRPNNQDNNDSRTDHSDFFVAVCQYPSNGGLFLAAGTLANQSGAAFKPFIYNNHFYRFTNADETVETGVRRGSPFGSKDFLEPAALVLSHAIAAGLGLPRTFVMPHQWLNRDVTIALKQEPVTLIPDLANNSILEVDGFGNTRTGFVAVEKGEETFIYHFADLAQKGQSAAPVMTLKNGDPVDVTINGVTRTATFGEQLFTNGGNTLSFAKSSVPVTLPNGIKGQLMQMFTRDPQTGLAYVCTETLRSFNIDPNNHRLDALTVDVEKTPEKRESPQPAFSLLTAAKLHHNALCH